ncbi:DUF2510 domain-containing protein [Rhodococcus hoagii]|nr:DUF2510 domain-containing protein [Prescottella equi]NKS94670.1 DUF2510 domain-containing protein [Prescottella equi]NKT31558.1 DUF2510 domain-containing protein [Prescottella equi]NKT39289.1 DUF2510 domain-containing protein [Prescottella equi]NKT72893.1 DUF2510 domain-containing protein [Prescottella equi]
MAKKKTNNVYLSIELADGQLIVVEAKSKKESEARKFAATVNQAAAVNAKLRAESEATAELEPAAPAISSPPPPPPPSVPEGWYRDPDGRPIQRYWNGTAWTDDTAPLPPS